MFEYWTWWQGGLALGGLTVLFRFVLHRPLGVSGSWLKIASSRQEIESEKQAQHFVEDSGAVNSALLEATLEQFGKNALDTQPHEEQVPVSTTNSVKTMPASIGQHAVFLLFIFIGGLFYAVISGRFDLDLELSSRLTNLSHGLMQSWVYLLLGGIMVGFGTQMAAGCTSGHGLSGCAQFSKTSLVASGVFFSSAVITAIFLSLVMSL